ncbi:MAG: citramalate synthase [Candidatus Poribacteria bacterium]|nr:citramalate synthase [Candidatus Poribacteria bacterium]
MSEQRSDDRPHVEIYDTTLRDGSQGEGIAFSVESKIRLLQEFDSIGIDFVEGGWPFSNPRDMEFYRRAKSLDLKHAQVVPFGSTRRKGIDPSDDPNLHALLETGCRHTTIFGKSWDLHATEILGVTLDENVELVRSSVAYLTEQGTQVIYDAEHFFDGYKRNREYCLRTLHAAVEAGAIRLVLCDTNGGTMPLEVAQIVGEIRATFPDIPTGIHTHNDAGMGAANAVIAVQHGATHVHGTFNGYGERSGNANLTSIVPNLELKLGYHCLREGGLEELTRISRLVSEFANQPHDERQPYVGRTAFAHKGGVHIDAARKNPLSYEHIRPEAVGNQQRILISDQAGKSAIIDKLERDYPHLDKRSPETQRVYDKLKEAEQYGYEFEGAEASFFLLAQKAMGEYTPSFDLHGFRLIIEKFERFDMRAEATIKVRDPNGLEEHTAAEGDGPVNALDNALRKALETFYPSLKDVSLVDYNVRVLDSQASTAARVRVLIESTDGEETWGTVGVSENIIQASWNALVDSLEYKIYKDSRRGAEV